MLPYIDHFGLSGEDLRTTLVFALSKGGDFAEVFLEYRAYDYILMEDDIVKETAESVGIGMGIRVLTGDQTGFGYTNDLSLEKVQRAALTAAAIAKGRYRGTPFRLRERTLRRDVARVIRPAHTAGMAKKIGLVRDAYGAARHFDPRVAKVKASLQDSVQYVTIANSEGLLVRDVRPMVRLTCVAIAEKNGRREFGYWGGGGRVGLEYFRDVLTPGKIGAEAAAEAVLLLDAVDAPAGEMPIVLSPGHSGVLIHEAVGHLLEADFNRKKTSVFWNKMGKKVGTDQVTIYDDPTIPASRGSYNVDDEGTAPRSKTLLIEKGVVAGLLQDRLSAGLMKRPLTGHGRRQDYSHWPVPRMSNTYIDRGEYDPAEILASVKKGFYVDSLQGGQVEDSGKFTFSVSLGHLIEDGRLTAPVRQATLIGTNIDILKR
ncbi:MAG TPA: TldD/PmbA family protein, partial [Acidobacteriota bacterium]|nr:TldD/PmbA family protein [Acidobacteriota bacterium]